MIFFVAGLCLLVIPHSGRSDNATSQLPRIELRNHAWPRRKTGISLNRGFSNTKIVLDFPRH